MLVDAYWNLHKDTFSVRLKATGRVAIYSRGLLLTDVDFRVQPAGREKAIKTGQKNVHAYVRGSFQNFITDENAAQAAIKHCISVSYNPFRFDYFYRTDTLAPVQEANLLILWNAKAYMPFGA